MKKEINTNSVAWNKEEIQNAKAILKKIIFCQDKKVSLPTEVFELHVLGKKSISTEVALFDAQGRVYCIKRPSLKENPFEPYPRMWHLPGATHTKNEFASEVLIRLKKTEGLRFKKYIDAGWRETKYRKRGIYMVHLVVVVTREKQKNPKGKFFTLEKLPRNNFVPQERDMALPWALRVLRGALRT